MNTPAEELTDAEIENLFAKGAVEGVSERFLWLGTAVVIVFLAALLLGLSGVPAPDSAHNRHVAEGLTLSKTPPQR